MTYSNIHLETLRAKIQNNRYFTRIYVFCENRFLHVKKYSLLHIYTCRHYLLWHQESYVMVTQICKAFQPKHIIIRGDWTVSVLYITLPWTAAWWWTRQVIFLSFIVNLTTMMIYSTFEAIWTLSSCSWLIAFTGWNRFCEVWKKWCSFVCRFNIILFNFKHLTLINSHDKERAMKKKKKERKK